MKTFDSLPKTRPRTPLLDQIRTPFDLRKLPFESLETLCDELRTFLLYIATQSGGHLGAGLGVVELTIMLHRHFDTPKDKLLFDVGHQSYPHKALTGRREAMLNIRQFGGASPFCDPKESPYDTLYTGHAGNALGAALGLALAQSLSGERSKIIALVGDGAMTAGQSLEALNHAGHEAALRPSVLLIINDNEMSISKNIGNITTLKAGDKTKTIFEPLGWRFEGSIDGHDLPALEETLGRLKNEEGLRVLHVRTQKGKGYTKAELDPLKLHHTSPAPPAPKTEQTFSQAFGQCVQRLMREDPKACVITPAMIEGSGLSAVAKDFPERVFDVGIAEQHAATLSLGLSQGGMKPILSIYSTFLQRAYDQLIHDLALPQSPVLLCVDRAGLAGPDGPTHHGLFDLAFLRPVPNLTLLTPATTDILEPMMREAFSRPGLKVIRYPRGRGLPPPQSFPLPPFEWGKSALIREVSGTPRALLINTGHLLGRALELAEALELPLLDLRTLKPLDSDTLSRFQSLPWITLEDHMQSGGAGSALLEWKAQRSPAPTLILGVEDAFIPHGSLEELYERLFSRATLQRSIEDFLLKLPQA